MKIYEETYLDCIKGRIPEITKEQVIIVSMYTGCHLTNPIRFSWEEKLLGKNFLQDLSYQLTLEEYLFKNFEL